MWPKLFIAGVSVLALGLATILIARSRLDRTVERAVGDLFAATETIQVTEVQKYATASLPGPVQRYVEAVIPEGRSAIQTVRMTQHGTFRGDGPSGSWQPFTATQHVTVRPPGFVWDAKIDMIPFVPVRVIDEYRCGTGGLWAKLAGLVTVMEADTGRALNEGELLRYLAEAPLYPTALLPSAGVVWTPINDRSALATLTDAGTEVSLTFFFNAQNEVERVEGRRPFLKDDGTVEYRRWIGYWQRYEDRNGYRIPTEGEVAWVYPSAGEASYWRGRIETVEYSTYARQNPSTQPSEDPAPEAMAEGGDTN